MYDVIIVGGGSAGLSAALILGRCRRNVLVIDQGKPRNAHAEAMHGFLTRDGTNPLQLLQIARQELQPYGVEVRAGEVVAGKRTRKGFKLRTHDDERFECRKLLLATGMRDQLPRLEGLTELYGISVHHCPYCDGWEWKDCAIAAYGIGKKGLGLALSLKGWSNDVALLTDGDGRELSRHRDVIDRFQISLRMQKIVRLEGKRGKLRQVIFEDGSSLQRDALFFNTGQRQKSELAEKLGCKFNRNGGVKVNKREQTCVPGLFLAGDASKEVQFVINAAAEGAAAAVAINKELQEEQGRAL